MLLNDVILPELKITFRPPFQILRVFLSMEDVFLLSSDPSSERRTRHQEEEEEEKEIWNKSFLSVYSFWTSFPSSSIFFPKCFGVTIDSSKGDEEGEGDHHWWSSSSSSIYWKGKNLESPVKVFHRYSSKKNTRWCQDVQCWSDLEEKLYFECRTRSSPPAIRY